MARFCHVNTAPKFRPGFMARLPTFEGVSIYFTWNTTVELILQDTVGNKKVPWISTDILPDSHFLLRCIYAIIYIYNVWGPDESVRSCCNFSKNMHKSKPGFNVFTTTSAKRQLPKGSTPGLTLRTPRIRSILRAPKYDSITPVHTACLKWINWNESASFC